MNKQWLFLAVGLIRHRREVTGEVVGLLLLRKGRTTIPGGTKRSIWLMCCLCHWPLAVAQGKIIRGKSQKRLLSPTISP